MTRSPSADAKASKRKGTRSVSTLTPSQLARKRANDREAQRAIRARTKEHIDRLERDLEELRNRYSRDETVQDLLRRNKALESELTSLRESLGLQTSRSVPQTPAYEHCLSPSASGMSSRTSSFGQSSAEYSSVPHFGSPYVPAPDPRESWGSTLPCSMPSVLSSPASSLGNGDDYMGGYIPTSVPSHMMERGLLPQPALQCLDNIKIEYEDMESDGGFSHHSGHHTPASYMSHHHWPLGGVYYPQSPGL
ncbi:hypothetical protein QBC33DRAFT_283011 [Phialemonium atrogriseum]|uniref:BZIP domain-containing protein n=1 Tax=Phialemonium atrogriseum TaxID=1093897 RepID=A0AAJ0BS32_9PEZI|nr:uncharacterized protein QBC33DRAFT_283011 [Phialemonium atrogriseum]KAK1762348.1 hypothetical protein QBC33DRAFT_283011 [Phialemonium atrogriseum]